MEKASTVIIIVLKGNANAKQIEDEFSHTESSKVWRWLARKIVDNKFSMRFLKPKWSKSTTTSNALG